MNQPLLSDTTRREFLKNTGRFAAATTIVSAATPWVHAAEDNTIRVALVGCGGRGTGAAADALNVKNGPIQLVALADVISERVSNSFNNLSRRFDETGRRAGRPPVRRLRRLQEGDGLPAAGRRRDPGHAARLPLGAIPSMPSTRG